MEWTMIASALIKNGPLVVIAAIFFKSNFRRKRQ